MRVSLNQAGTAVTATDENFATFSEGDVKPLDVTTMDTGEKFPGTIWIAAFGSDKIYAMEPNDFGGGGGPGPCEGTNDPDLDEDGDGYDNADEIDNQTDPCSAASMPGDHDGDFTSDLNDPDDDNDGTRDKKDRFAIDRRDGIDHEASGRDLVGERHLTGRHHQHWIHGSHDERIFRLSEAVRRD